MSRINLEQLATFLSVVRLGGINKAAVTLNLTQPAVTARIKTLERSLNATLFERSTTGMRLTNRGELLVKYAEQFEQLNALVEKDIIDPLGIEGTLRLGVSETIAQCWLPELIAELHRQYPRLDIEFNVDVSTNLRADLLSRQIDLAILLGPVSEYTVDNIELPGFDLSWYAASSECVEDPAACLCKPVLTYARNTRPYRELKAELFRRVGPEVSLFASTSLSACFRLVEAGLGVAALPTAIGNAYVQSGSIQTFDPGWTPQPLQFSASYLGEPQRELLQTAATSAYRVAKAYNDKNNL